MGIQVQSVRGVGSRKGYPYYAAGLYQVKETSTGKLVWVLVDSSAEATTHRAALRKSKFDAPVLDGVRNNSEVTARHASELTGISEVVALDKIRDMM